MPSSWLLSVGTLIASSIISPAVAHPEPGPGHSQGYQLVEKWQGKSFMDHIEFFNAPDPTNGYVNYLDQKSAENAGLFKVNSGGSLYMGVDHKTTLDPSGPGRDSVRIESKKFYEEGLYIVDIKHMPGSICGTWPAFWSVGPKWPDNGEIDIIEGVNMHNANEIVLHTSGSCALSEGADMSGSLTSSECGDASGTIGCVVKAENGTSGTPFNKQGGGVYAMERAPDFMKIWYFPRGAIPKSIAHGKPDTASFGTPMANLQGSCDFKERFTAQKLIFNTDFCGDWAGGIYGDDGCPMSDPSDSFKSCETFVATNPEEFKEAYWEINSVQIFQAGLSPHASSESSTTSAIETAPADTASATKIPATSDVESAETTAPAPPSSVSSEPPAPETDLPAPATSAKAAESTLAFETSPAAPETKAAAPAASTAPETHGASIPVSRSTVLSTSTSTRTVPRSTVYTTSTTTICNKSAAAIGGGHASAPTGSVAGDEDAHETLDNASSTLSGNVRMGAAASETFATGERAATSSSAPSTAEAIAQSAASTPCETVPVPESSQPAPVPASSDVPESGPVSTEVPPAAHVPASSEHSPATSVAPETTHGAPIPAPTEASQDVQVAPSSETNHDAPTPASTQAPQAAQVIPSPEITHDAPIPASTEAPQAAHVPASSESSPAGPSGADAVGNSNAASSSAPSTTPSASLSSPASSGSPVAYDPSSSSTGSSPSNSHALFTGAASRLSVGATGLVGVLAVAVLV